MSPNKRVVELNHLRATLKWVGRMPMTDYNRKSATYIALKYNEQWYYMRAQVCGALGDTFGESYYAGMSIESRKQYTELGKQLTKLSGDPERV